MIPFKLVMNYHYDPVDSIRVLGGSLLFVAIVIGLAFYVWRKNKK